MKLVVVENEQAPSAYVPLAVAVAVQVSVLVPLFSGPQVLVQTGVSVAAQAPPLAIANPVLVALPHAATPVPLEPAVPGVPPVLVVAPPVPGVPPVLVVVPPVPG